MKVTVIDKHSGKPRAMESRFARILTKLGRATYMTRDMRAAAPAAEPEPVGDKEEGEARPDGQARRPRKAKAEK